MSQAHHWNNAEQSILSGTQPLVCQLSSKKSGKPIAEDGSHFTTTMRALTHLMSHPPYSTDLAPNDLFLFPYVKNKMRGSECMFWRYLNQSDKSASTIGSNACKGV